MSKKLIKLDDEYNKIQLAYIQDLLEIASSYGSLIHQFANIIAFLDVIISFAMVVNQSPFVYVRPEILDNDERKIILKKSRHPCLESICDLNMASSINTFIPNDIELIQSFFNYTIFII